MKSLCVLLLAVAAFIGGLIADSLSEPALAMPPVGEVPQIELMARKEMGTYGWVYPCADLDAYTATLKRIGEQNNNDSGAQARDNKRYLEDTHFCYPHDDDPMVERWNRQRALNAAIDAGWSVAGYDGEAIAIYHPKIMCNNGSRAWGK